MLGGTFNLGRFWVETLVANLVLTWLTANPNFRVFELRTHNTKPKLFIDINHTEMLVEAEWVV